jgi:hypothetical protein
MRDKRAHIGLGVALIIVAIFGLLITRPPAQPAVGGTNSAKLQPAAPSGGVGALSAAAALQGAKPAEKTLPNGVRIINEVKHDTSPPLRDIPPAPPLTNKEENENPLPFAPQQTNVKDPVVQNFFGPHVMPTPILTFDGIDSVGSACGCLPPDTNGDVGPNHYVQTVNSSFAIWDKNGTVVQTPRQLRTLFTGFGGPCQTRNDGDPVVLYDQMADRWFISQFLSAAPYGMCIAISTSPDPTGSYNRYYFQLSLTDFYDYEKYGVWPDGYYMSANVFEGAGGFHPAAVVYDRAQMLAGATATAQEFNPGAFYGPMQPSDLDGPTAPPAGSPNFYVSDANTINQAYLWKFHVDWATPANSSFTGPTTLAVAPFDPNMCGGARQCIPQSGTAIKIDAIADRPMYRLVYRNMGNYETLLLNHTVDVDSTDHAGVRWYEFRDPNGSPFVYQQGTYAPDAAHRWMGSIGMDHDGNIALGYSTSSSTIFPEIRYTGRLATDPLGQMSQGEATLFAGTGSQTSGTGRWGDYSSMSIDPSDDCTFWYTQEYYATTSPASWKTRIGKFAFPGCGTAPTPTPGIPPTNTPQPTATSTPQPPPTVCANYSVATGTATIVPGTQDVGVHCDDCGLAVPLPFPVTLYDQTFNSINVSSNGVVSFGGSNFAFGNACLPVPIYDYSIMGFWDDLTTNSGGDGVYSTTTGTSPNRTFYLEFRAKSLDVASAPVNFEFVFHEGSDDFEVVYGATVAGNGLTATSGVQRNMQYFTQYSCNSATLLPGLMLSYTIADCPVPTVTPTSPPATPTNTPATPAATNTPSTPGPTATACAISFSDVPVGSTFYEFIRCLACRGIINGYPDGTFKPNNNVTRGQLSKIVSNSAGFSDPATQMFEDVPPGSTFFDYIGRLASRGYINGYPCGGPGEPCNPPGNLPYFRPNANATRGQISKIVSNAAGFNEPVTGQTFQDVPPGSTFYDFIERLAGRGVMSGYPCGSVPTEPCVPPENRPYFRPNNNATRGQTSKIVANTFFPACQTPGAANK